MSVTAEKTVGELALENPAPPACLKSWASTIAAAVVELWNRRARQPTCPRPGGGLAGGGESARHPEQRQRGNWQVEPLSELIAHIRSTPPRLYSRRNRPLGPAVRQGVLGPWQESSRIAAPARDLQRPRRGADHPPDEGGNGALPVHSPHGRGRGGEGTRAAATFRQRRQSHCHDGARARRAGNALRGMRDISHGYAAPPDACISFQTLYQALSAFEADLHQHIHLENNILFPRAIKMEQAH